MFKNPFSFKGRIRRTEFGISYIMYMAGYFLSIFFTDNSPNGGYISFIIWLPLLYFLLAQGAKRCHDRGNSGFYQLIPFYVLWLIFADSEVGPNRYGPNPKGIGNNSEIDDIGKPV